MSDTMVLEKNVNNMLVEELTTSLLRLSRNTIDKELATTLAKKNLEIIDLNNPFIAHKGLSWVAEQILKDDRIKNA